LGFWYGICLETLGCGNESFQEIFLTFFIKTDRYLLEVWDSIEFCFFTGHGGLIGDNEIKNSISEKEIEFFI
jgi:hypothetical protein